MHGHEQFGQDHQTVQTDRGLQTEYSQRPVRGTCRRQLYRTASDARHQKRQLDWLQSRVRDQKRGTQREDFRKFQHDELQYYRR